MISRRNLLKAFAVSTLAASVHAIAKPFEAAIGKLKHNIVHVYSEADLPTPVDGVITMQPNTNYVIMHTISTKNMITGPLSASVQGPKSELISNA